MKKERIFMKILLSVNQKLKNPDKFAAELGFDGVEYMMTPDCELLQLPKARVVIIHAPIGEYDYSRFCSALHEAISTAILMGAAAINIHPGSAFAEFGGRENVQKCIAALKEAAQMVNIPIYYELLAPPKNGNEAQLRQQAYDNPNDWVRDVVSFDLNATLDVTHLAGWDVTNSVSYISLLGQNLRHVHLSDYCRETNRDHRALGEGHLPIRNFLTVLNRFHRNITVTLELGKDYTGTRFADAARKSLGFIREAIS